jgi:hypothetical protein
MDASWQDMEMQQGDNKSLLKVRGKNYRRAWWGQI